jgi:hypothetical protein
MVETVCLPTQTRRRLVCLRGLVYKTWPRTRFPGVLQLPQFLLLPSFIRLTGKPYSSSPHGFARRRTLARWPRRRGRWTRRRRERAGPWRWRRRVRPSAAVRSRRGWRPRRRAPDAGRVRRGWRWSWPRRGGRGGDHPAAGRCPTPRGGRICLGEGHGAARRVGACSTRAFSRKTRRERCAGSD